jgi:hypothetical protein
MILRGLKPKGERWQFGIAVQFAHSDGLGWSLPNFRHAASMRAVQAAITSSQYCDNEEHAIMRASETTGIELTASQMIIRVIDSSRAAQ